MNTDTMQAANQDKALGKDTKTWKAVAPVATKADTAARVAKGGKGGGVGRPKAVAKKADKGSAKPSGRTKGASGLDGAARVLKEFGKPMNVRAITEAVFKKGYWKSGGKTPGATIAAAMLREIAVKGKQSRFKKSGRGMFSAR